MWDMCVCLFICAHIYVYICMRVCVCVCTHSLLPLFSLVLQRLLLRPPPWVQRACVALLESVKHDITWLRVLVREIWMSGCYEQRTRKLFPAVWPPRQQILQRMLFPQGLFSIWILDEGRRGISEHVFGICKPFVRWKTRHSWKACQPLLEQRRSVELLITGRFHCGSIKRGPPSESAIRRG